MTNYYSQAPSLALDPAITVLQAEMTLESAGMESMMALIYRGCREIYQQTRGLAHPTVLWASPSRLHYLGCTRVDNTLYKPLLQFILETHPTIRIVERQPVLERLGSNGQNMMVLFNPEAVEDPECIGWLVGGKAIYRPLEIVAIAGV